MTKNLIGLFLLVFLTACSSMNTEEEYASDCMLSRLRGINSTERAAEITARCATAYPRPEVMSGGDVKIGESEAIEYCVKVHARGLTNQSVISSIRHACTLKQFRRGD